MTTGTYGVAEVTGADFGAEVLGAELPVLVKFTADWCPPCRQLAPVLGAVAQEAADRLKVVELNVDRNPELAVEYGVMATPTLMVFRDGEPVRSMVGARPKRKLLEELEDVLTR
ncbi:thioredoxin family protein [Streptomyces tritici]|uniref:thioredoxin family protein n=1 Tax=Streptomyces tritici TaxID=2054410 RepID=UPI003AF1941E